MAIETLISRFDFVFDVGRPRYIPLGDFLEEVRKPPRFLESAVSEIRKATTLEKKDQLKKKLYCVTPSGIFDSREDNMLKQQSGIVCVDIDHIKHLDEVKEQLCSNPFALSVFISPSGEGLKVFVKHDLADVSLFRSLYFTVGDILGVIGKTDMKFDTKCSNISRACFFSVDPEIYVNEQSETFHFEATDIKRAETIVPTHKTSKIDAPTIPLLIDPKSIEKAIIEEHEWFEQRYSMYPGTRNNNLYILANLFRNAGIPEGKATDYLIAYYSVPKNGFDGNEIATTVRSAYAQNTDI